MRPLLFLAVLIIAVCAVHIPSVLPFRRRHIETMASFANGPPAQMFEQQLDHFDVQERRTWYQRYFINDTFFNQQGGKGPIFFQIGGEGAISAGYVTRLQMVEYGQRVGALLVALEHRFYGESHPFPTLATENLRYLSSEQALADAAYFLETEIRSRYPNAGKVISFGGSYPGALSAWFRFKYPHVTAGSVASSAPVLAELDMIQYLEVVDQSLSTLGGPECDTAISKATAEVQSMLKSSSGREQLRHKFNLCQAPTKSHDVANFMSALAGNFMGEIQYNGQIPSQPSVKSVCDTLTSGRGSILDRYVAVWKRFVYTDDCTDISYDSMIDELRNITDFGVQSVGMRSWTYQTCSEFGYYQTTDSENQPFGDLVPIQFYLDMCRDVFGFDFPPRIDETNINYGGKNPIGSNVLFVNGGIDPWHSLSITENLSDSITAIVIPLGSHCENMSPAGPNSPPLMAEAQQKTYTHILEWLKE